MRSVIFNLFLIILISPAFCQNNETKTKTVAVTKKEPETKTVTDTNNKNAIVYDFYNHTFLSKPKYVSYKNNIYFKIININTFIYNTSISYDENNFNTEVPNLFSVYLLNLPSVISDTNKDGSKPKEAEANQDPKLKKITDLTNIFLIAVDSLEKTKTLYTKLQMLIQSNIDPADIIQYKERFLKELIKDANCGNFCKYAIYTECTNRLNYVKNLYNQIMSIPDTKANNSNIENVNEIMKKINAFDYMNLANELSLLYDQININMFTVYSPIITAKSDEISFKVNITPKTNLKYNPTLKEENFKIPINVQGGVKFDFSTGLFGTNLMDYYYVITRDSLPNDTIIGYKVIKDDHGKINIGLLALMHITWRIPYESNIGLNFGVGIDNQLNIKYLGGVSLILGKEQRFIINGGIAVGQVNRLSSSITENKTYKDQPVINTIKITDTGFYFGISYNFTTIK